MNKRKLHHYYKQISFIRPWYFLVIAIIAFAIGVYSLRQNNLTMIELRQAVIEADEEGGNIEKPLQELRDYVYSHMNTDLSGGQFAIDPPIQLTHQYERMAQQNQKSIENRNQQVKARGESICADRHPASGFNSQRVECVQRYIQENAVESSSEVPEDLYKFDFVSPKWTPDLAGISLLLGLVFSALFVVALVADRWVRSKI